MDWQDTIGMASVVIALCALIFSFWQAAESREHNRLSLKPHLTTWAQRQPDKGVFDVELINSGLGPAIIKRFTFLLDGQPLGDGSNSKIEHELKRLFPSGSYEFGISSFENGYAMSSNERRTVFHVKFLKEPFPIASTVEQLLDRGDIEITYHSFYGEEFKYSSKTEPAIKPLRVIVMEQGPF
jgi:hypothetical protein